MDLERQKRNQVIRVVITEALMVLAIIPIVILLTLLAMGYHLGDDLTLEQSGLVQINSIPNGATVSVDGEEKFKTDAGRMLAGGKHEIEIVKDGYDGWRKKIDVTPGLLLRIRYARLFKTAREAESVEKLNGLQMLSVAPSRTKILYQLGQSPKIKLMDIRGSDTKISEVDLTESVRLNDDGDMLGKIGQVKWSWNGDAILLQLIYDGVAEWLIVTLRDGMPSRNLSKDFGITIANIQFSGNSMEQMYALENGNLREINLETNGISRILLSGVEDFYVGQANIAYVNKVENQRVVGLYKRDDSVGIAIQEIREDLPVRVALSEYYGEKYFSYTVGDKLTIYLTDAWPTSKSEVKKMQKLIDAEIDMTPSLPMVVNRTGEVILIQNKNTIVSVDLETNKYDKYEMPTTSLGFIDDYLLCGVKDRSLIVWDFDGENQRTLTNDTLGFSAVISANNHWLYYVAEKDGQPVLTRERL